MDIVEFTTYTQPPAFILIPMGAYFCMLVSSVRLFGIYI